MKMKKTISMLVIAIIAVLMLTAILGSVQAVDAAPKKVKVTWHANGGKIGKANTKITTVKKNAKVKLLKAPTRTGYTFTGWYTKKTGGKKISSSTKIKKKVTHYAQWKKKANGNTDSNIDSKLIGGWNTKLFISSTEYYYKTYTFNKNGTFMYTSGIGAPTHYRSGNYKVSDGKITFTNVLIYWRDGTVEKYPQVGNSQILEYKFVKLASGKEALRIPSIDFASKSYVSLNDHGLEWYKE